MSALAPERIRRELRSCAGPARSAAAPRAGPEGASTDSHGTRRRRGAGPVHAGRGAVVVAWERVVAFDLARTADVIETGRAAFAGDTRRLGADLRMHQAYVGPKMFDAAAAAALGGGDDGAARRMCGHCGPSRGDARRRCAVAVLQRLVDRGTRVAPPLAARRASIDAGERPPAAARHLLAFVGGHFATCPSAGRARAPPPQRRRRAVSRSAPRRVSRSAAGITG